MFLTYAGNDELLAYENRLLDAQALLVVKLQTVPVSQREAIRGRIDDLEDKLSEVGVILDSKVGMR